MKTPAENSRQVVDRFLGKLGEPLSPSEVERAIGRVRQRLDDAEALSTPANVPRSAVSFRWSAVAAAVLVILVGGAVQMVFLRPDATRGVAKAVSGEVYFAESYKPLSIASRIEGGQVVRAGSEGGALALQDGSRVEMSPRAELSIVPASDGTRVRLGSGTVIVTAAKQRNGHLYVETKDLVVSVVGTVFSVSAEAVGSRVSVIEGEVHVQQGKTVQTLLSGQQASTSPALGPLPVETELGWSKSAGELVALLQQSAPEVPAPVPAPQANSRVIQGSVKLASKQEGISGVTVTACPGNGRLPYRVGRSVVIGPGGAEAHFHLGPGGQAPQEGASIIRNRNLFVALFDGAAGCANPIQARTDAAGRFQLQDLSPGDYVVRAALEGYFGVAAADGTYPTFANQQLTVDAQQPVPEVSFLLVRSGSISGRVRDAEGKLLANASVWAVPASGNSSPRVSLPAARLTDDRGEYRLFGLPPGEYRVGVGLQGSAIFHLDGAAGGMIHDPFLNAYRVQPARPNGQTFYPNAASVSEAATIVLKEGEEIGGIDIVTRPALPSDAPVLPAFSPYFRK
jgi:hypothetical protein